MNVKQVIDALVLETHGASSLARKLVFLHSGVADLLNALEIESPIEREIAIRAAMGKLSAWVEASSNVQQKLFSTP
jgi:hypothetical protein